MHPAGILHRHSKIGEVIPTMPSYWTSNWQNRQPSKGSPVFLQFGRPVSDQHQRCWCVFGERAENDALAIRAHVERRSHWRRVGNLEQRAHRLHLEFFALRVDGSDTQSQVSSREPDLLTVTSPGWKRSTGLRDLPSSLATGKMRHVYLFSS